MDTSADVAIAATRGRLSPEQEVEAIRVVKPRFGPTRFPQILSRCVARNASRTLLVTCSQQNHVGGSGCRRSRCSRTRPRQLCPKSGRSVV